MRKPISLLVALLCGVVATVGAAGAQSWSPLNHPPSRGVSNCLLLTDGSVICQSGGVWLKLSPDASGSYVNGTWSQIASFPTGYVPDAYASAVLADGRALVVGGEYNNGNFVLTNAGAVYDPRANTWTTVAPPANITYVGDAPACVLADGRFLIGSKLDQRMAVLDPATMLWTTVNQTGKIDGINSEEGWTLLPDGSIFTLDVQSAPAAERFIPATATWVSAGNTPVDLHTPTTSSPITVAPGVIYYPPGEIGPTLRRPDGTIFVVGATGQTAIFTPPPDNSTDPGSWALGPHFPSGLNIEDGPGAVLPNGHVLAVASPGATGGGLKFFEFDGTSLIAVPTVPRANSDATYFTSLLVLPTGQVMFVDSSSSVQIYTATGTYDPAWAPAITDVPPTVNGGATYQIAGTGFNGVTQATAFGDESQNATNYPLVRITNSATGHVVYARTHDHSSMGVATGSTLVGTYFDVPASIESGASSIAVVANGIPSAPVSISVISTAPPTVSNVSPSSGPVAGGTSVSISGANFGAGASVTIGGIAATVGAVTANAITATTPAHAAGAVTVVVTNTDGRSGSLANGFTYRLPAPALTSLTPTSGATAGQTSVTLSGMNFVGGARVRFGGSAAAVHSLTATTITVSTPSHAAGAVDVVVTNPDGQSATLSAGFTYRAPAPTVNNLSPKSGPASGGTTVKISGHNFAGGATVAFGGTPAAVLSISSGSITVKTPAHAPGLASVVVTNADGQSASLINAFTFK